MSASAGSVAEGMTKSKRKRLRKRAKENAAWVANRTSDLDNSLALVTIHESTAEPDVDEDIEVIETKGFRKMNRPEECTSSSEEEDDDDDLYCSDEDDFYTIFGSSDEGFPCNHEHFCTSHNHKHYSYEEMKDKKRVHEEKKFAKSSGKMSESVDGYIGDKSMDYIMDFLGEKVEPSEKKKPKAQKKKTRAKEKAPEKPPKPEKTVPEPKPEEKVPEPKPEKKVPEPKPEKKKGKENTKSAAAKPDAKKKVAEESKVGEVDSGKVNKNNPPPNPEPQVIVENGMDRAYHSRVFLNSKYHTSGETGYGPRR